MTDATVQYIGPGVVPTEEQLKQVGDLAAAILSLPDFEGKRINIVLNGLLSAYWTAACRAGMQERTAEGMVQMGGTYLAGLELARAGSGSSPQVH